MKYKNLTFEKITGNILISISILLLVGFIAYIFSILFSENINDLVWAILIVPTWFMLIGAAWISGILAKDGFFDADI